MPLNKHVSTFCFVQSVDDNLCSLIGNSGSYKYITYHTRLNIEKKVNISRNDIFLSIHKKTRYIKIKKGDSMFRRDFGVSFAVVLKTKWVLFEIGLSARDLTTKWLAVSLSGKTEFTHAQSKAWLRKPRETHPRASQSALANPQEFVSEFPH